MEVMFQWFWLVKLTLMVIVIYAVYKGAYIHKFKNTMWNMIVLVLVLFAYMLPVKMVPTTNQNNVKADRAIAQSKGELPAMKADDSFKKKVDVPGISKEDLK